MFDALKKEQEGFKGAKAMYGFTAEQVYDAYYYAHMALAEVKGTPLLPETATVDELVAACASVDTGDGFDMKSSVEAVLQTLDPSIDPITASGAEYVAAADEVHRQWIRNNYPEKYDDPKRADKKYQFGSLELNGFNEVSKAGMFVESVYRAVGITPATNAEVKHAFETRVNTRMSTVNTPTSVICREHDYLIDALGDKANEGCRLDLIPKGLAKETNFGDNINKETSDPRMASFAEVIKTAPNKDVYGEALHKAYDAQVSSSGLSRLNDIKGKMDVGNDGVDDASKGGFTPLD